VSEPALLNNRYQILGLLDEDGLAVVYKGRDTLLGRPVAIKMLREQYAADAGLRERFRREAQAAAALAQPDIISIFDVGDQGCPYIVMEYVEGPNLQAVIQESGPLPVGRALDLANQVCAAVVEAHRRGIHLDLKTQHILLTADGRAKLTDFSLSAGLASAPISAEQAQAAEVHAIGVLLYEMLTGRPPFQADSAVGAAQHPQETPPPPRRLNPLLPPAVEEIVLKALASDPAQRWPSVSELGQALLAYRQTGEQATLTYRPLPTSVPLAPLVPSEPTTPAKLRPRAGIDWLVVILGLLAIVGLLGLGLLGWAVQQAIATPVAAPAVVVPDLVGRDYQTAEQIAQAQGLRLTVVEYRHDEVVPAEAVIAQLVAAGDKLRRGDTIGVILSQGSEKIPLPNVVNLPITQAETQLAAAGLAVEKRNVSSDQMAEGQVVSQEPPAETPVAKGSTVRLAVSMGRRVAVPSLVGRQWEEAQRAISEAGLSTTYVNWQGRDQLPPEILNTVPIGHVLSQIPEAGKWVERGTTVFIAVRKE
jgi:beta-lactam-binding protein with PASTA domain/tRNA A-37 threonylcarbamoyl transferase component Bud32